MKALTLYRPWAWCIVHGPKRVENRPWKPWPSVIGRRVLIHAGATWDKEGAAFIRRAGVELVPAANDKGIIGSAVVAGYVERAEDLAQDDQRRWFFGPVGWVLEDVVALPTAIPCRGALGLWDCPAELLEQVAAGYARRSA